MSNQPEQSLSTPPAVEVDPALVKRVIEAMRPAVQADGGDLELVEVTKGGIVRVRLHGACVGCPSSDATLKMGIERNLRAHVPGITGVEPVED